MIKFNYFSFPPTAQVSDWWEEYIYLRGRGPIMVNSNYYAMVSCFLWHLSADKPSYSCFKVDYLNYLDLAFCFGF